MYNGGYSHTGRSNSLGFGIVVAGHAALLLTIALNPTIVERAAPWIQEVRNIPAKTDPPPPPKPEPTERAKTETVRTKPIVETGTPVIKPITLDPPVTGAGPIIVQPPVIEPVFRQAQMDPKAMGRFQPPYPSSMVRSGIEGSVTVKVLIGVDGRVKSIEPVKATNQDFFTSTRDHALRAWRFQPATRDGIAIESWRTMTVKFLLES